MSEIMPHVNGSLAGTHRVRHVFVYGTLRRGQFRDINALNPAPRWVGEGVVNGVLYHLGSYPGLAITGSDRVCGEVYEIDAALEQQLDEIEEVLPQPNGEYIKREVMVQLTPPVCGEVWCLVYEASGEVVANKSVISSGDWVAYCRDHHDPSS